MRNILIFMVATSVSSLSKAEVVRFNCMGTFIVVNTVPDTSGNFTPFKSNKFGVPFPSYLFDSESLQLTRVSHPAPGVKSTDTLSRVDGIEGDISKNALLVYVNDDLKITVALNIVNNKPNSMTTIDTTAASGIPELETCVIQPL